MIRFRPKRRTPSAEAKDEQIFQTVDELVAYLFDHFSRILRYIGSEVPLHRNDIRIDADRNVFVNRNGSTFLVGVYDE